MIKKIIILLTVCSSNMAFADIYKYVDSTGRAYYTDEPRHSLYKRIIKTSPNHYKVREGNAYPTVFSSFSRNFDNGRHTIRKNKFSDVISNAAYRNRVDEKLVHAVIQTESAYNAGARSPAGAVGLMQLMPDTAKRYGVLNRTDPVQNVDGGTRYLKDLLAMFNYNLRLAVAAYNAGENAVIRHNNSIPPYPETQNYVRQVLALYNRSL
ncbi:MAG: transglycosylase SLT domain-containing protein [Methyloglobulus sp.]|nr:lytic transglycosylase domain-containing protein [Methyloglobulus sp.]